MKEWAKTLFFLVLLFSSAPAARISGQAFEWYSLEPLSKVIVDLNSQPEQTMVTDEHGYTFEVPPGTYSLQARYFENNRLKYEGNETLIVNDDGNFSIDLILFPVLDTNQYLFPDQNDIALPEPIGNEKKETPFPLLPFLIGIVLLAGIWRWIQHTQAPHKTTIPGPAVQETNLLVPQTELDLEEILSVLHQHGGRMTQKELRSQTSFSEAKVSLILTELEQLGKIKKFQKGRGNILILNE